MRVMRHMVRGRVFWRVTVIESTVCETPELAMDLLEALS